MQALTIAFLFAANGHAQDPVRQLMRLVHEAAQGPRQEPFTTSFDTTTTSARGTHHVKGSATSDQTLNATFVVEDDQDGTFSVRIANLARPQHGVCHWPTSGTITKAAKDGSTQTLAFAAPCGTATLNGVKAELPSHPAFDGKPGHEKHWQHDHGGEPGVE